MKNDWCRALLVAAAAVLSTADAHAALRGLAVAHGSLDDGHDDRDARVGNPIALTAAHEDVHDWIELDHATRDVPTDDDAIVGGDADDASGSNDNDEGGDAKSYAFDAIANEANEDEIAHVVPAGRGATGGYVVQNEKPEKPGSTPSKPTDTVPIGESAAAAKPISEIANSAIQKDPVAYGVVTPVPSTLPPIKGGPTTNGPIGESAAAAKPISKLPDSVIQSDKPVPIGESAAAAKPITDIDPAAIQRDPKSYGVLTPAPAPVAGNPNPAVQRQP